MNVKNKWFLVIVLLLLAIFLDSSSVRARDSLRIQETVFARKENGETMQRIRLSLAGGFPLKFMVQAKTGRQEIEESFQFSEPAKDIYLFLPACSGASCAVELKILDENRNFIADANFELKAMRRWKIYLVPFTHTDIGFTQSQKKVLRQNLENLRLELGLIEQTRAYPEKSRFKLFTEVSWAVDEFLKSPEMSDAEKGNLKRAIQARDIELGAFYISHQNKFMPDEALFASLVPGLKITDELGEPLRTACLNDVFDFSSVVKPLFSAGVKYLIVGPNDARYIVPPLFYLMPPAGKEKILVWHTAGLNGYGENFDLKMRLALPLSESAFSEMEALINGHLKSMENGYPTATLSEYYDYYGASWEYPYDAYLLPYYPVISKDNQAQNIAASEIAKKWNEKWLYPEMIVSTPSEFFEYVDKNFSERIPVIKGEMSGFWGEQIFLSMMQVDPQKERKQREFERNAVNAGMALADKFLTGDLIFNPWEELQKSYQVLILNNDHNPVPVPFGGTKYTMADIKDWKHTRRDWIAEMEQSGISALEKAEEGAENAVLGITVGREPAKVFMDGDDFILENRFYRVRVDGKSGGIKSLLDKELNKELVRQSARYQLNQYLHAVRGEDGGLRDYLQVSPGFISVKVQIGEDGPEFASIKIDGSLERKLSGADVLSRLADRAFGIKIPASTLNAIAELLFFQNKKALKLSQEIILPSDEKQVQFIQSFSGNMPQWVEHIFAYPLNFPETTPIEYDAGYNLLSFTPAYPLGKGDIVPSAKNTKNFPSINASLVPFQWMYGLPPDFTFRNYLMLRHDDFAVAFTSRESGAVIPGTLKPDPIKGPFGGGFYHLGLGWTLWGWLGLGASLENDVKIHSGLTSYLAKSDSEARDKAMDFSWNFNGKSVSRKIQINPSSVKLVNSWLENNSVLILRVWETCGRKAQVQVKLDSAKKLKAVYLARSDGKPLNNLAFQDNSFFLQAEPGEIITLRLEFD